MPDTRQHRGPHPEDPSLFAPANYPALQSATYDLSWLLSHGYALPSSLKIVGDRYQLTERQRLAIMRSSCSDLSLHLRQQNQLPIQAAEKIPLLIDGYNLLTTIEAALGHSFLLLGRDHCLRDLASMHGHYKRVAETTPALELIGQSLADLQTPTAHFLLDAPVSNSARLKTVMQQLASQKHWPWQISLLPDPDPILAKSTEIIVTADSIILDGSRNPKDHAPPKWLNLALHIVTTHIPSATIIPMTNPARSPNDSMPR
ncbi:MAG TPA: DUF434 domain-containing protein [Phycisphaerae bacterium]|nr:DUF434 domain-containing protein [Phycisphaerae bacterium]